MPDFSEFFKKANWQPIIYNEKTIIRIDKFPVSNGDTLLISIEKTNKDRLQGVAINITGSCEMDGQLLKKGKRVRMIFWEDASVFDPKNIKIRVLTNENFVWVQNIWANISPLGTRSVESGNYGAAMIVEEIEHGRRYRCNDGYPDENFDDIVFTVTKLKQ